MENSSSPGITSGIKPLLTGQHFQELSLMCSKQKYVNIRVCLLVWVSAKFSHCFEFVETMFIIYVVVYYLKSVSCMLSVNLFLN